MDNSKQQELQPDEMRVNVCGVDTVRKVDYIELKNTKWGFDKRIPVLDHGEVLVRHLDGSIDVVEGMLDACCIGRD